MFTKRIAIVSVINDLVTDNRVLRAAQVLSECDYEVELIGRELPGSLPVPPWQYKATRMNLLFRKGPLFYLFFNLRLFLKLLFRKADLLYANDLDTLLPSFIVSRLRGIPLIYDSHELFCEVPELMDSKFKRKIWLSLEEWIVPKLKYCITVNESIAGIFERKYHVKFHVVRNIGEEPRASGLKSRRELGLPEDKKIILLQGAGINIDRGAEELVDAMALVEGALLLIIGGGDVWRVLQRKVNAQHLRGKVRLIDKIPKDELRHYTRNADLGISIDKNTNLNYYYSLPNKIFDYIHAGLPILASRLPEIERIVDHYQAGGFIENHQPGHIAYRLEEMLSSPRLPEYRSNSLKAAKELNWQQEREKLREIINGVRRKP